MYTCTERGYDLYKEKEGSLKLIQLRIARESILPDSNYTERTSKL